MWRWLSVAVLCWASGCSEPSDSASPAGAWQFDATWGNASTTCRITAATLTIGGTPVHWAGTLSGGEAGCEGIPGEVPVLVSPPEAVLDSIRVRGDSIAFVLAGANAELRGVITSGHMNGVMNVFAPLCDQCTGPSFVGTWTAAQR